MGRKKICRMLPNDIMNIIALYNEDGIFVKRDETIYWFNGKRFEFWCKFDAYNVMTYNYNLYITHNGEIRLWKNKQFVKIEISFVWNHPLQIFFRNRKIFFRNRITEIFNNNICYRFCNFKKKLYIFDGQLETEVASIETTRFSHDMMSYKNDIYLFGETESKKYNIQTHIVSNICAIPTWYRDHCLYDFNGKFYDIGPKNIYFLYDPEIDIWEERKFVAT